MTINKAEGQSLHTVGILYTLLALIYANLFSLMVNFM